MIVVIPIHNQAKNLTPVLGAYLAQTKAPKNIVLVLDRCTDNSKELAESFISKFEIIGCKLHVIEKIMEGNIGFGAGSTRDFGVRYALDNNLEGDFLFSDGDCIPSPELVAHHEESLVSDLPRITCGLRYETIGGGQEQEFPLVGDYVLGMPVQTDMRLAASYCEGNVFGDGYDRLVMNPDVIKNSWICWSCNLGMNRAAINLCHAVNGRMDGDERRVFNSAFDGNWGGEDGFVGATLFHCGGEVIAASQRSWVTHIWHPRTHTNLSHMNLVLSKEQRLIDLAIDNQVPCDPTVYQSSGPYTFDRLDIDWLDKLVSISPSTVQKRVLAATPLATAPSKDDSIKDVFTAVFCLIMTGLLKYYGALPTRTYIADRESINNQLQALKWQIKFLRIGVNSNGYFLPRTSTEGT